VKQEIPVVIVFRALGCEDDRAILEHILYDFDDMEMMELLKPSLEKAMVIQKRDVRCGDGLPPFPVNRVFGFSSP
jgi:DNA-directed RNA polymerase II subunit RPB2